MQKWCAQNKFNLSGPFGVGCAKIVGTPLSIAKLISSHATLKPEHISYRCFLDVGSGAGSM